MRQKREKNRGLMLFCICCNTFCFGGLYAWSAFSGELAAYMGWEYSQVTFAYSLQLMVLAVMGLVGGALLQRFGAKRLMITAGILWGMGWMLTGFASSIFMLYLSFGVLTGCASSFGYNPGTITAVSWFPDRKGFASGMAVGVCGIASLVVAPFANFLLTKFDVLMAFRIVGLSFLLISLATTWYIDNPPEGWRPKGYVPTAAAEAHGKTWREMLRDPRCYLMWATLLCASVAGLMLIGHASQIGQEIAGITAAQAALLVGIMAVANFFGRLVLGALSDVLGRYRIVIGTMVVAAADMLLMATVSSYAAFVFSIIVVSICFSGTLATFPALCSDVFGAKYNGINYSIIFTGYGTAGIVGPSMATALRNMTGSFSGAFYFAAGCSVLAALLCFALSAANKRVGGAPAARSAQN